MKQSQLIPLKVDLHWQSASTAAHRFAPNADLDILVRKSDFARAQALLGKLGFAADEFDRYHQPWIRGTTMVELHEDVVDPRWFDFDIGTAWECAKVSGLPGRPDVSTL